MQHPKMTIRLFGGLRAVSATGHEVEFSKNNSSALLAVLALRVGEARSREQIAAALWPEDDAEEARIRLRQALYHLRHDLAAFESGCDRAITASRDKLELSADLVGTDLQQFQAELAAAERSPNAGDRALHTAIAVETCRGELLQGFYQECFVHEQHRISELYATALHALPLHYEAAADAARATESARAALAVDPTIEETHCCLMRLYAASGQPSAVVRQYRELEHALRGELGEEPSASTRALMESLRESGRTVLAAHPPSSSIASGSPVPVPRVDRSRRIPRRPRLGAAIVAVLSVMGIALFVRSSGDRPTKDKTGRAAGRPPSGFATPTIDPSGLPEGSLLWQHTMPLKSGDKSSEATAAGVDSQGNVYITGFVDIPDRGADYLTQKYSPEGLPLWQRRYNGTGNDLDRARSLVVDPQDNVVVTGESENGKGRDSNNEISRLTGLDIVTVKYKANGDRQFVQRWNGPANGEDRPVKVSVIADHHYAVSGSTWSRSNSRGKGGFDFVTLWMNRDSGDKSVPVALSPYRNSGRLSDMTTASVLDAAGNAYLTGSAASNARVGPADTTLTMKVDINLVVQWVSPLGGKGTGFRTGRAVAVDSLGCTYVVSPGYRGAVQNGGSAYDIITTKLGPGGAEIWSQTFSATRATNDWPTAIVVDPNVGIVVAGEWSGDKAYVHLSLVSYDANGNERWRRTMMDGAVGPCAPKCLAVANNGDITVAGVTSLPVGKDLYRQNVLVMKLDKDGNPKWLSRLAAEPAGGARAEAMAIGKDGSIVVTGQADVGGKQVIITAKFAP